MSKFVKFNVKLSVHARERLEQRFKKTTMGNTLRIAGYVTNSYVHDVYNKTCYTIACAINNSRAVVVVDADFNLVTAMSEGPMVDRAWQYVAKIAMEKKVA